MNLLIVTDNRYWRGEIGSHKRIQTLCAHFLAGGHALRTFFVGRLWQTDEDILRDHPLDHPLLVEPAPHATASPENPAPRARALRQCIPPGIRRTLKQLRFEIRRRRDASRPPIYRHFALQTREPKLADFHHPHQIARFRETLKADPPDVICVEYVRLAYLLDAARDLIPAQCLKIIDTHDVQYERQSRFHERGDVHDIDILPSEEAAALSQADVLLAIQARDGDKLAALVPQRRVIVAPHPHPVTPQPDPDGPPLRIGFFGSDMAPNRQAAQTLVTDIWPALAAQHPGTVSLHLYGSVCRTLDPGALPAGVHLEGFVADLAAAYASLHIVANPVDFGGGLKIKCVEALCYGKPLVTTQVGAEGMEDGAGHAMVVADTANELIAAFDTLLRDRDARQRLAQNATAYARTHFAPEAAFRELDALLAAHAKRIDTTGVR